MDRRVHIVWLLALLLLVCCLLVSKRAKCDCQPPKPNAIDPSNFPLKFGSAGANVSKLQDFLNNKHCAGLEETGIMDTPTTSFMKAKFQKDTLSLNSFVKWGIHKT